MLVRFVVKEDAITGFGRNALKRGLLAGLALCVFLLGNCAQAQDAPQPAQAPASAPTPAPTPPSEPQQLRKWDVSGGYSLRVYTDPSYKRLGLNGWYGQVDYNVFRWLTAVADVSGTYRNQGINGNLQIYSAQVGPRLYPFGHRKIAFFGEVLAGDSYYRIRIPSFGGFPTTTDTDSEVSWQVGGGVDYNRYKRWSIRVIEVDYQRTGFFTVHENNYRASIGVVYHFGIK